MHGIQSCLIVTMLLLFKKTHCSYKGKFEPFVVKGEFGKIRNYPHCVYIFVDCNNKWICGSSVLNQRVLLTAAHCLFGCGPSGRIDAFAGNENIKKVKVKRKAQSILIHEDYSDKSIISDIGLLLLKDDLPLSDKIKRIIITKQNSFGLQGVVAGWGLVNDIQRESTSVLKWTNQKVRSEKTCLKVGRIQPGTMCAGSLFNDQGRPSHGKTLAEFVRDDTTALPVILLPNNNAGDSGSALITANYRQIGIVSFRYPTYPGLVIYTNTSYFYDWIKRNSRALYCGKKYSALLRT